MSRDIRYYNKINKDLESKQIENSEQKKEWIVWGLHP